MRSLLARKIRPSVVVEPLEGRQLLSTLGWHSGPDAPAREVASEDATDHGPSMIGPVDAGRASATDAGSPFSQEHGESPDPMAEAADGPRATAERPQPMAEAVMERGLMEAIDHASDAAGGTVSAQSLGFLATPKVEILATDNSATPEAPTPGGDRAGLVGGPPPAAVASAFAAILQGQPSTPGPAERSPGDGFVATSQVDAIAAAGAARPLLAGPLLVAPVNLGPAPNPTPGTPARVGPAIIVSPGPASIDGQVRIPADGIAARGGFEVRTADATPPAVVGEPERSNAPTLASPAARARTGEPLAMPMPDPQVADMITSLLPFDRSSLEDAVGRFLEPLDGLVPEVPGLRSPIGLVSASLTVAATVIALDLAIRVKRSREEGDGAVDGEAIVMFPGLPGLGRLPRP